MRSNIWSLSMLAAIGGCATQDADPEQASYFMVSQGEASFVYRALVGGVDYCKVTQSNLMRAGYIVELEYDGDTCRVTAAAENKD